MRAHSSRKATVSSWTLRGWGWRRLKRRPSMSHMCSMGLQSGEAAGHCKTLMLLAFRKFRVKRATCGRALSCWKVRPWRWWNNGRTTGVNISLTYLWALRLPLIMTKSVRNVWLMAADTITPPPPKRLYSKIQLRAKRSLRRLYTRTRPSAFETLNRDLSLNTTDLQCLARLSWAHCRRSRRWRSVRTTPRWGLLQTIPRSLSRFRTVFRDTVRPRLPSTTEEVAWAVVKQSRKWRWRI